MLKGLAVTANVTGKSWGMEQLIIAALVRRLGGRVELGPEELAPSGGLVIDKDILYESVTLVASDPLVESNA